MRRCIDLASCGAGRVAPNPLVGAVLVHEGRIIGEGYHEFFGGPHAEVNCIKSVAENDRQHISSSQLYVSLEPCSHFGKTPPCSDLIIASGIREVYIGCADPFAKVNGRGIQKLRAGGIKVHTDILNEECLFLNRRFFTYHEKKRPYIILKWAQSADGYISAAGGKTKISNSYSDIAVHKWRTEEAAILIGTNTALLDDPLLTARHWPGKDPVRIVLDRQLKVPDSAKIFSSGNPPVILNASQSNENDLRKQIKITGDTESIVKALFDLNLLSVIIEGGSKTLQLFIDAGLWDEVRIITNESMFIKEGVKAPENLNGNFIRSEKYFNDIITYYTNPIK